MNFDLTGLGSVADAASTIVNKFLPDKMSDADKAKTTLDLQKLLTERENIVVESQKSILIAELNQSDAYTKRARPTVVYAGLLFIMLVHVIFPMMTHFMEIEAPVLTLPEEFWWTWGGICSVWSVGRSMEKRGIENKAVNALTGIKVR